MKKYLLAALVLSVTLFADIKVGDAFPKITLQDQFGKAHMLSRQDRLILMAFEKDVSIGLSDYLKNKGNTFLSQYHARFISDISSMPSFITSMFALPKMRKYPFPLLLIRDDSGKIFDRREGKITVYTLKNFKVSSVKFLTVKDLDAIFRRP
ncbi:hypothetical protein [Sulfurovum sp. NBC37-1]|uniref:hypothetical protein n=1 Tax=Sulfurovum sp. (strain NBC37-1) TaxID=387093 RepID=UPI0001587911|nr:hypothetical protein [Sulfurovum sp. NBC37-1]BAF72031.1 conserved hypothetical protein [Sulfurovum sp. NBC37-1]